MNNFIPKHDLHCIISKQMKVEAHNKKEFSSPSSLRTTRHFEGRINVIGGLVKCQPPNIIMTGIGQSMLRMLFKNHQSIARKARKKNEQYTPVYHQNRKISVGSSSWNLGVDVETRYQ